MWEMLVPDFWGVAHRWEAGWLSRTETRFSIAAPSRMEQRETGLPSPELQARRGGREASWTFLSHLQFLTLHTGAEENCTAAMLMIALF